MSVAAATERAVVPPQFGIARWAAVGHASHGIIYEHEYQPKPVRHLSLDRPVECDRTLRPAIRNGKVAFRFFGCRVPQSADHARCWLGSVLREETRLGRLENAELLINPHEEVPLTQPGPLQRHGPLPTWQWHIWVAGEALQQPPEDPQVEVLMSFSPFDGVGIHLQSTDEKSRCFVYRVLRQYCDDDGSTWHPIPEQQKTIGKVTDRSMSGSERRKRLVGLPEIAAGGGAFRRHVATLREAETCLLSALERLEAAHEASTLAEVMNYMHELKRALQSAQDSRLALKPHYKNAAAQALDLLLRRVLDTREDKGKLTEVRNLAVKMYGFGVCEPKSLREVENRLAH